MYSEEEVFKKMVERRRDFHRYPETGWAEFRTTSKIAETLTDVGMNIRFAGEFVEMEHVLGRNADIEAQIGRAVSQGASPEIIEKMKGLTGLTAEIDTGRPGPVTAIRFDIDCVETTETEELSHLPRLLGFNSVNPNSMHACAHDGHAAVGMTLAEKLFSERSLLKGKVRFIFQPAEEGARGGYAFVKSGAVDGADYFLTLHLGLGNPTGTVFGGTDGFLYSTKIDADYKGVGAHAGAEPQKGKNALLAAASAALSIHGIAPSPDGLTRTNVGVLNAGDGRNVVPPKAHMKIETRGATEDAAVYIYRAVMRILHGAAEMYDVKLTTQKCGEAISASSDRDLAKIVMEAASSVCGVNSTDLIQPMAGSDDACWMMKKVQDNGGKATYIGIGADTKAGHHNDHFDFDENAMGIAFGVLYRTVFMLNGK
ncbi:MAG: amidohydrolase [Synergistaceae bacterium]